MAVVVRLGSQEDTDRIAALWADRATSGASDACPSRSVISEDAGARHFIVCDAENVITGAALGRRMQTTDGLVLKFEPFLYADTDSREAMLNWIDTNVGADVELVEIWVPEGQQDELDLYGYAPVRTYRRLDLIGLDDVAQIAAPANLNIVDGTSDLINWVQVTSLYNDAFAGEWHHWNSTTFHLQNFIWRDRASTVIGLEQSEEAVGLIIARIETFTADPRPQPLLNVHIVCSAARRRREHIAEYLLRESLIRARDRDAGGSTIRADLGSAYESHRLYQKVGYSPALDFQVWSRRVFRPN